MNFLNPFALLGLVAAGIPVLLHLLNLRRLRTMEFSTLRFLQELQQTRVRNIKIQQILLLILRTLLVIFAVLAFARPTITSRLPFLGAAERTSVVILIDNSASMAGADQQGRRIQQAVEAANTVLNQLREGDEVCIVPMCGQDVSQALTFTRMLQEARNDLKLITTVEARADLATALRTAGALFDQAAHAHREIYVISDAQRANTYRQQIDSTAALAEPATVFLVRVGDGLQGLEQNLSIDSMTVLTSLFQPQRPIEIEAKVRNGSDRDATGVLVTMSFNGTRVAQRALDVPAGATRSIVLSAPPQRRGLVAVSAELENDAIDGDNVRYAGVMIPEVARYAIVGQSASADMVASVVALQGSEQERVTPIRLRSVSDLLPMLGDVDVAMIVDGVATPMATEALRQFVEQGGGLVVFASEDASLPSMMAPYGVRLGPTLSTSLAKPWNIVSIDDTHPLFYGVFQTSSSPTTLEKVSIQRQRPATGGLEVVRTDAGALVSEGSLGAGRVIYIASAPDAAWGGLSATGFFAATVVRASLFTALPRDNAMNVAIGQPITMSVPGRHAGQPSFRVRETHGVESVIAPARLPSATLLQIPPQQRAGVVTVATTDSTDVMAASVNVPTAESLLDFMTLDEWAESVKDIATDDVQIVTTEPGRELQQSLLEAKVGSELWPLCILLALLCAGAESVVSRLITRGETATGTP